MQVKLLSLVFITIGVCSGALTASQLSSGLSGAALAYHEVGENVRLAGPNGQGGAAVISGYRAIVSGGGPLPAPGAKKFPKPTQFALCSSETSAVLEILETLSLLKENVDAFTPAQVAKIRNILSQDMMQDAQFSPSFAAYVPACADGVNANGAATQDSYQEAINFYSP